MSIQPPKKIPDDMLSKYTLDGQIPLIYQWYDGTKSTYPDWTTELVNNYIEMFNNHTIRKYQFVKTEPYKGASFLIYSAFNEFSINKKTVAVVGSLYPWVEAICLNNGAISVTTVEYNVPKCSHDKIKTQSFNDFLKEENKYDIIVTFSSVEHSGLGRYGDPLNPTADIETMDAIHKALKSDGLLFWGAPVGHDCVVFNAHRIYGHKRLNLLFEKFNILKWFGCTEEILNKWSEPSASNLYQPIIVLNKKI